MPNAETGAALAALGERIAGSPKRGRWLVLTHDNPDPDALASAAALALVLRRHFRRNTTVAYGGIIGRAENRETAKSLHLNLVHVRQLAKRRFDHYALVDCQPWTGNAQLADGVVPDLVIDHHPVRKATKKAAVVDIRPKYGATATILHEYLEAVGIEPPRSLATGMIYAIRSETQDFAREAGGPDHAAYDRLTKRVDRRLLARIQNARLPVPYFRNLHRALEGLSGVSNLVVSQLGAVDQPDIVPEIADLLLRMEGKTWSLCTGSHGDRVYVSIRTTNSRADAGNLMRRMIGTLGKGGGHGTMAGGFVAIPKTATDGGRAIEKMLVQRFVKALGKNPERVAPIRLETAEPAVPVAEPPGPAKIP